MRGAGHDAQYRTRTTAETVDVASREVRALAWDIFPDPVAAHGELPYDESFVFTPLLSLGGEADVQHLRKRPTLDAIRTRVEFQGVIGLTWRRRPVRRVSGR